MVFFLYKLTKFFNKIILIKMSIDLIRLFNNPEKIINNINLVAKIFSLNDLGEIFTITLKSNNINYKDLVIVKGEIFPNPKKDNLINIDKIIYKYDENFKLRIYLNAKIINDNNTIIENNNNNNEDKIQTIDFSEGNIIKTLKTFLKLKENLFTSLFIVDSENESNYSIKSIEQNKLLSLNKNNDLLLTKLNKQDIILINEYDLENKNIILSPLSIIEKLNDEKLFFFLENNEKINNKLLWGKILEIDIDNKIVILMDKDKNILKFQNTNNYDIKLGQFFIFSNYIIDKKTNEITLNKDSFFYFSSQDVYFSTKIRLNFFSVIQLYFIDYKSVEKNLYKAVKLKNEIKTIRDNEMIFTVENKKSKIYEFFIQTISLLIDEQYQYGTEIFYISVLQGFINKYNVFINYKSNFSYYYEYLYYSFDDLDFLRFKTIKINDSIKKITIYDNFGSQNRIKFNILNIPFQNECQKNKLGQYTNSLSICETFYKNPKEPKIYGIFNITEIMYNSKIIKADHSIFDKYYDEFGFIFDDLKISQINNEKIDNFIEKCRKQYLLFEKDLNRLAFQSVSFYEEKISLSQLKARIGIISSYYLANQNSYKTKHKVYKKLKDIVEEIVPYENIFTKEQILRIFILLSKRIIELEFNADLVVLSDLEKDTSPYVVANDFNLEEIRNINEFSRLFSGYLQMDSLILFNYDIGAKSYSFSLEPIFILKYHLTSNYEGFFLTENHDNNVIAWTDVDTRITIINKDCLFERSELKDISFIKDDKVVLNNLAFGITIVNRHEKNSHQKKNLKNGHLPSPFNYCDNGEKKTIYVKANNNEFTGEDGVLIETLIGNQSFIISLAKDFIYGQLLDYRLFIAKDFEELKKQVKIIREKNAKYFEKFKSYKDKKSIPNETNEMKDYKEFQEKDDNISKEEILKIIKKKELQLGDQIYSLDVIKEMIRIEKLKNQFHLLPKIIRELDKELNENKK
jgi:hypothetical protein